MAKSQKITSTTLNHLIRKSTERMGQSTLYGNAIFLMLNSISTSLLGFVFWRIMAASFAPNQIGIASTLISSSILLGTLANMGLGVGLIRFVPLDKNAGQLVNAAFTITCIMAVGCSLIYLAKLNVFAPSQKFMLEDYKLYIIFVAIIVCTSLSIITDQSLVAARCARFVFLKNVITCLIKLPLPILFFTDLGGYGIFAATGIAIVIGLLVSWVIFLPSSFVDYSLRPILKIGIVQNMLSYSFWNFIADFLSKAPGLIYPLIITNICGAEQGAYFYIAWMMAMVLSVIPTGISQSLLSEGSHEPKKLAQLARKSFFMAMGLSFAGVSCMAITSGWLLGFFGADYSQEGALIARLLAIAVIPQSVNLLFMAVNQVKKKMALVLMQTSAMSLLALGMGFWMLKHVGPSGVAIAYVIAHGAVALFVIYPLCKMIFEIEPNSRKELIL